VIDSGGGIPCAVTNFVVQSKPGLTKKMAINRVVINNPDIPVPPAFADQDFFDYLLKYLLSKGIIKVEYIIVRIVEKILGAGIIAICLNVQLFQVLMGNIQQMPV